MPYFNLPNNIPVIKMKKDEIGRRFLDEIYKNSEKANPLLPGTFTGIEELARKEKDFANACDKGAGVFLYLYYIDTNKLNRIKKDFIRKHKLKHYENALGFLILQYAPTSVRERFEFWKEKLKDCKDWECIMRVIKENAEPCPQRGD